MSESEWKERYEEKEAEFEEFKCKCLIARGQCGNGAGSRVGDH